MTADNPNEIEAINREIEKYSKSARKVKNVVPLVTITSIGAGTFFLKDIEKYPVTTFMGMGSIIIYVCSFVYAYLRCTSKVKVLKNQLDQLQ